jgi:hypothetical protein
MKAVAINMVSALVSFSFTDVSRDFTDSGTSHAGKCGYKKTNCGDDGCISNCDAKAMCGRDSADGKTACGLNLCCKYWATSGKPITDTLTQVHSMAGAELKTSTVTIRSLIKG